MKSRTPSRPGGSLLHDRVLCQRLESCLEADTLKDMDDVTNYLRDTFPEYRRQKFGPFKLQLQRAADAVARRRPELFGNEVRVCQVGGMRGGGEERLPAVLCACC